MTECINQPIEILKDNLSEDIDELIRRLESGELTDKDIIEHHENRVITDD